MIKYELTNGRIVATDDTIKDIVKQEIKRLGNKADLNHIDTSNVTDMSDVFYKSKFNGDISQWDTSNVTYMSCMFLNSEFNGDISNWGVSKVEYMIGMFAFSQFNGDISNWDVSNIANMGYMFYNSPLVDNQPAWYKDKFNQRRSARSNK